MDRSPASRFVHYFDPGTHGLACQFVGAHVGWAIRAEQVDCPACRQILARLATAATGEALAAPRGLAVARGV